MDRYKTTFETWNKVAQMYNEKFAGMDLYNDTYDSFCDMVKEQGASVLEIGCGPGNITKYLLSKRPGFKITATDVAPNMVALAKQNNPAADCFLLDVRSLETLSQKFHGVVCGFCLPYLSKEDCEKLFADVSSLILPGGTFYLSTIEGDYNNSGYEKGSSGDSCYVYYHNEGFLIKTLEKNGFALKKVSRKSFSQSAHKSNSHLIVLAQKV